MRPGALRRSDRSGPLDDCRFPRSVESHYPHNFTQNARHAAYTRLMRRWGDRTQRRLARHRLGGSPSHEPKEGAGPKQVVLFLRITLRNPMHPLLRKVLQWIFVSRNSFERCLGSDSECVSYASNGRRLRLRRSSSLTRSLCFSDWFLLFYSPLLSLHRIL